MMRICVKNSTMVKPDGPTPDGSILWISNLDNLMNSQHAATMYIYRHDHDVQSNNFFDPSVVWAALGRALVAFYPAAGRLGRDEITACMHIDCNTKGVLFVEAESNGTLDDLGDFTFKAAAAQIEGTLVPVVDYSQGISTYPLILIQVTHFKCGGVSLGLRIEHHLSDGMSSLHFINTWSDIARGLEISIPPVIDRTHLSARNPPESRFDHIEYQHPPAPKTPQQESETTLSIFKLTSDQINALKASCKEDGDIASYSSFEVLAGHIWRCTCKARGLRDDQESRVEIPVDGRSRLQPPLPQGYYGNVIFPTKPCKAMSGEIQSKPLNYVVNIIHNVIIQMDNDYL